jgi:hypothetical protein
MIVSLAAFIFLQAQSKSNVQGGEGFDSKELDPKTRPIVEFPRFKDRDCVSVSAYRMKNPKTKKLEVTRVFRFTYQARFNQEGDYWAKALVNQGWSLDKANLPSIIYDRDLKHPKVVRQALLLHDGRAFFDSKAKAQTRVAKESGWVWISLNETIKDTSW